MSYYQLPLDKKKTGKTFKLCIKGQLWGSVISLDSVWDLGEAANQVDCRLESNRNFFLINCGQWNLHHRIIVITIMASDNDSSMTLLTHLVTEHPDSQVGNQWTTV